MWKSYNLYCMLKTLRDNLNKVDIENMSTLLLAPLD